ncbi:MAG: RNA polymerase sigma factor [Nitrospinales bacterium]
MEAISTNPKYKMQNTFSANDIEHLVLKHSKSMHIRALQLCKNPDKAEDLVQETVFHGIKNLYQLKDRSKSKYWLLTILKNQYFKEYGDKKRLEKWGNDEKDEYLLDENIPEKLFLDRELCHNIHLMIEKLADHLKTPLEMFYFHNLSYKETSDKLRIPIGTVMSRIARAKAQLKKIILNDPGCRLSVGYMN